MTHDELLMRLWEKRNALCDNLDVHFALSAVVELHKPFTEFGDDASCEACFNADYSNKEQPYPCYTIDTIVKALR